MSAPSSPPDLHRPSSPLRSESTDSFVNATAGKRLRDMTIQDSELPPKLPVKQAPIFARPRKPSPPPSSAFPTSDSFAPLASSQIPFPRHPEPRRAPAPASTPKILAVEIPASSLRPLAFRVFTKKHNLTLKSDALSILCSFIGRKCGAEWKNGSAEKLLEEIARTWKRNESANGILVDGGEALKLVLKGIEGPAGGAKKLNILGRGETFDFASGNTTIAESQGESQVLPQNSQFTTSTIDDQEDETFHVQDYLQIVNAFTQPKFNYNTTKKQFERASKPKLLPPPTAKHLLFHTRYNILYHRLLRNPSFQPPTFTPSNKLTTRGSKTYYKITPIANLLGRAGLPFYLFGLLSLSPETGLLVLEDPTGSIELDTSQAAPVPQNGAWFNPGSFALLDGIYESNGKFTVGTIGQPPCERRESSAEIFGHVDLLGINIPLEFSTTGSGGRGLRRMERQLADAQKGRVVILNDVHLDLSRTHEALSRLFTQWEEDLVPPLICVLCGKFVSEGFNGSMAYKEAFDQFANTISVFTKLQTSTTFIFVPSDADPWTAAFTAGAAGLLPRKGIPDIFTTRTKRLFSQANSKNLNSNSGTRGKVVFTSNPARISYFTKEIVVFRDELGGRFNRNSVRFKPVPTVTEAEEPTINDIDITNEGMDIDGIEGTSEIPTSTAAPVNDGAGEDIIRDEVKLARKLVKTILDQSFLSPFPLNVRPLLWDYTHTLSLFPLPSYLILADPTSPAFAVVYEGCCVVNPGRFLVEGGSRRLRYAEFMLGDEGKGGRTEESYF